jgi:hypothetical protein
MKAKYVHIFIYQFQASDHWSCKEMVHMLNIIRAILVKGKGKRVMCIVTYNIIR